MDPDEPLIIKPPPGAQPDKRQTMRAKSISGNSPEQISARLDQLATEGFHPSLAMVFVSIKQDREAIRRILDERDIDLAGATSSTEFVDGHQSTGGIAILLLELPRETYSLLFEDIGDRSLRETGEKIAREAREKFSRPALLLCSTSVTAAGGMLDGETLVRTIEKSIGSEVNMFGGMAGDDMSFVGTYVFTRHQSTGYGVVVVVLNEERIGLHGVALSGWSPVGVSRTMTRCRKNLLYEIDGKPALETYLRFLGEDFDKLSDPVNFFNGIGLYYPLQIERSGREPMMCNPMGYNKDENALILESDVEEGARFRFSTPPDFDIVETVISKAGELRQDTGTDADAVLIFSCASRLSSLGPMASQENDGLAEVWKAPMAGFYTYGEFGRGLNGKHEFHSTTCSWVALKEK